MGVSCCPATARDHDLVLHIFLLCVMVLTMVRRLHPQSVCYNLIGTGRLYVKELDWCSRERNVAGRTTAKGNLSRDRESVSSLLFCDFAELFGCVGVASKMWPMGITQC